MIKLAYRQTFLMKKVYYLRGNIFDSRTENEISTDTLRELSEIVIRNIVMNFSLKT